MPMRLARSDFAARDSEATRSRRQRGDRDASSQPNQKIRAIVRSWLVGRIPIMKLGRNLDARALASEEHL